MIFPELSECIFTAETRKCVYFWKLCMKKLKHILISPTQKSLNIKSCLLIDTQLGLCFISPLINVNNSVQVLSICKMSLPHS